MTVYTVFASDEYENTDWLVGVFTTLELARKASNDVGIRKHYGYVRIYQSELDNDESTIEVSD